MNSAYSQVLVLFFDLFFKRCEEQYYAQGGEVILDRGWVVFGTFKSAEKYLTGGRK
jgi:hypothetical protein